MTLNLLQRLIEKEIYLQESWNSHIQFLCSWGCVWMLHLSDSFSQAKWKAPLGFQYVSFILEIYSMLEAWKCVVVILYFLKYILNSWTNISIFLGNLSLTQCLYRGLFMTGWQIINPPKNDTSSYFPCIWNDLMKPIRRNGWGRSPSNAGMGFPIWT